MTSEKRLSALHYNYISKDAILYLRSKIFSTFLHCNKEGQL